MKAADRMSTNQSLSISEMRMHLKGTRYELFMEWLVGTGLTPTSKP